MAQWIKSLLLLKNEGLRSDPQDPQKSQPSGLPVSLAEMSRSVFTKSFGGGQWRTAPDIGAWAPHGERQENTPTLTHTKTK